MIAPLAFSPRRAATLIKCLCPLTALLVLSACATSPVIRGGTLTSYEGLAPANSARTRTQLRIDREEILAARTVRIVPTRFADGIGTDLSDKDRALVANRVDRALCKGLSRRLKVVATGEPADLNVQATIARLGKTNEIAAGASVIASFVSVVPLLNPRVPFGLGNLGIEAEALDAQGQQRAAILWSRKAQPVAIMSGATISRVSDAYQLASAFGDDFGDLVTTGSSPFDDGPRGKRPKRDKANDDACDVFGDGPGILGMVAENFGMPPGWTDNGARKNADAAAPSGLPDQP